MAFQHKQVCKIKVLHELRFLSQIKVGPFMVQLTLTYIALQVFCQYVKEILQFLSIDIVYGYSRWKLFSS